jgi:hypothetical protein
MISICYISVDRPSAQIKSNYLSPNIRGVATRRLSRGLRFQNYVAFLKKAAVGTANVFPWIVSRDRPSGFLCTDSEFRSLQVKSQASIMRFELRKEQQQYKQQCQPYK